MALIDSIHVYIQHCVHFLIRYTMAMCILFYCICMATICGPIQVMKLRTQMCICGIFNTLVISFLYLLNFPLKLR